MQGDTRCRKWGGLGVVWPIGSLNVADNIAIGQSAYKKFLLAFHSNFMSLSCTVSETQRDMRHNPPI